ncbi:hypothetical protein [uncultured Draconibacterium sp.]|uniref:hypothetical protein n=1 Tax=uncultured Draconibacterium sp. TaxID=1573823 RepID=UPI0029C7AC3A|nr:hypothetical protein [uncultured Draconibacterium sp.]
MAKTKTQRNPWFWIPTLYFAEGLPYVIVMTLSVIMYKRLGISNTDIALYTSWLYLPWVIKPLWSPIVDLLKTKRFWIVIMQLVVGVGLAGVAFTIPVSNFFQYTLAFFWLLAFSSATHDIAADGFYMLGLSQGDQSFFVGIRSTFYRFAMLTGQGLLVIVAGALETATGLEPLEVNVTAQNIAVQEISFNPESYQQLHEAGDIYFVSEKEVKVPIGLVIKDQAADIKRRVDEWNINNNFYTSETPVATKDAGWWTRKVSAPLKETLKEKFNKETVDRSSEVGNLAIIPIQLSTKPEAGEEVVLNFGYEKGDASIKTGTDLSLCV